MSPIDVVLLLALGWPLMMALLSLARVYSHATQPHVYLTWGWVSAPWPALLLAFLGEAQWVMESWLLGALWELDAISRAWLAFTALLWSLAALHARGYFAGEQLKAQAGDSAAQRRMIRLAILWPLTLTGNVLLIVAEDIASFYLGFALMTFAAYGLVIHTGTREALHGGRAYLILAVLGEGLILGGLLWGAGDAQTLTLPGLREGIASAEQGVWMAALLWLGFGVKAGVMGLHVWLPLAHPVAPAPASAVLSGAMIKAGLLGWLNVFPLGLSGAGDDIATLGRVMLVMGLAAAFGAALYGIWQRHPKAVLAYSSISQMGMLTSLVAMGLVAPDTWPFLWPAVVLFAAHHALAKGALFMGTSVSEHPPRMPLPLLFGLLALPGLSLAGALGAGMVSKWSMKNALYAQGHTGLITLLTLAAVGTSLLVSVTLWRQWQQRGEPGSHACQLGGWLAALIATLLAPLWLPLPADSVTPPPLAEWWGLVWPYLTGIGIVVVGWGLLRRGSGPSVSLPAGDAWWLYACWVGWMQRYIQVLAGRLAGTKKRIVASSLQVERHVMRTIERLLAYEGWLRHHTSGLMMALALVLALLMLI
ncbi:proton-conducting transporter membrane subunit [Halomonas vilamensis]|uniref:Proton-conducting transporter membrane subunit n=1 Tax=Vreelandella vilamensis TaxID=531309 RepID=A0ABU1H031_9GAMM|nr:proton-conducting transporter membrane subunit [Halomonas vilamensis]MDR5897664.1 proton-conducting transporter membrane subunit [Halomonas vilamensis]